MTINIFNKSEEAKNILKNLQIEFPNLPNIEFEFPNYKTKNIYGTYFKNKIIINNNSKNSELEFFKFVVLHELVHHFINSKIIPGIFEIEWKNSYYKKISHSKYFFKILDNFCEKLNIQNFPPIQKCYLHQFNQSKKLNLIIK